MAEDFFRVHKGITISNTSASANIDPISIRIGSLIANTTGVYTGVVNATSVNTSTANATSIAVTGQINTATLFATTSANVGANVQLQTGALVVGANVILSTLALGVGNSTANLTASELMVKVANSSGSANLQPTQLLVGNSKINSTSISVTDTVILNTTMLAISGSPVALLNIEDQSMTGGARCSPKSLGTITTGTVTPDPGDRPFQTYVNNGAHTLAPGANHGFYLLTIGNGASAGAITTSGWTKVTGDSFTTTSGHNFRCHCSIDGAGSLLSVQAMQ